MGTNLIEILLQQKNQDFFCCIFLKKNDKNQKSNLTDHLYQIAKTHP